MNDKTDQNVDSSPGGDQHADLSPAWEMQLAREVRALDREIQPERNLWPGIERKIEAYPQPKNAGFSLNWMQFGMAASVLMAFSALVLNLTDFRPETGALAFDQSRPGTLETMQVEYLKTRDPLEELFAETNRDLAPETLEELYRNIEIVAQARTEIESQVRKDPTNRRLVEQLMRIHERELELLKQDFSKPSRSM
tara:strand:+ start:58913 stop:59500 length:588 start_codon:yes stop_codon:yes gene_type:complete